MKKSQVPVKKNTPLTEWFRKAASGNGGTFPCDSETAGADLLRVYSGLSGGGTLRAVAAAPNFADAEQLFYEMNLWNRAFGAGFTIELLPDGTWKGNPALEDEAPRAEAIAHALSPNPPSIVVGSVHALLSPVPDPDEFAGSEITLRTGDKLSPASIVNKLVSMGYDDEPEARVVGEFSRRGGILDIFSPDMTLPARIEFFGDEIDSIRQYSPENGRSVSKLDSIRVIARSGTAVVIPGEDYFDFSACCRDRFLILCSPEDCQNSVLKFGGEELAVRWEKFRRTVPVKASLVTEVEAAELHLELPRDSAGVAPLLKSEAEETRETMTELARTLSVQFVKQYLDTGYRIILAAAKSSDSDHIAQWLAENKLGDDPRITVENLALPAGIILTGEHAVYLTERELFSTGFRGKEKVRHAEDLEQDAGKVSREELQHIADIEENDICVHLNYGICKFRGIHTVKTASQSIESLELEFADDTVINVPVWQAHLISRYIGAKAGVTQLSKLGGTRWLKNRDEAAQSAKNLACEMLRMQALRSSASGISFPHDSLEQKLFEDSFPYQATDGQVRASEEIKKDMESDKPMDRLLCGDVGYGKTEVAMRAAFKCVSSGKQVAVLVPTTVLAQQHFLSFTERFAEYPFTIDTISRLRSSKEKKAIFDGLASGGIDIIIGTHALLSPDVHFKDLGLVIIDEEQRFGVEHKEKLKTMRTMVDVLTMTATPIPRTLHMSMSGLRDLSAITTAPVKRMPVHTIVMQEDNALIAAAISRELTRGGQVFYLHNRVASIRKTADKVRQLAPHARIEIAHGQMRGTQLEDIMNRFVRGEIDILVCTTIIESGIDIPNANTIIIDRADTFGLAELHQLRGRVGRWNRQAYAYLLIPPSGVMTSDGRQRMSVIRKYTHLGAGFQLALNDLRIRGAGNIIGAEQSGYVNTIGFHLYCQLLKEAADHLRGIETPRLISAELNFDFLDFALTTEKGHLPAGIPPSYIEDERLRLDAYRRLAFMTSPAELNDFRAELKDRFGPLPLPADNFLKTVELRILVASAHYAALSCREGKVFLERNGEVYRRKGVLPVIPPVFGPQDRLDMLLTFLHEVLDEQKSAGPARK